MYQPGSFDLSLVCSGKWWGALTLTRYYLWLLLGLVTTLPLAKETIYVVESYHADFPWDLGYKNGLEDVLADKFELVYFEMDTKRLPPSRFPERAEIAWRLYQRLAPKLVILADDNALAYLGSKLLKTQTPVVYLGINANPRDYGVVGPTNFTGVLERPLFKRSIKMIDDFIELKKALVLFDSGTTAKVVKEEYFAGKTSVLLGNVKVDIKLIATIDNWKKNVISAPDKGYDALIVGLYHTLVDDKGTHVRANEVIEWTSANTAIPPFGFWGFSIGRNMNIGGYVTTAYAVGELAGKQALIMLAKENKRTLLPIRTTSGELLFSKAQLHKWKIKLPEQIKTQVVLVD